MTLAEAAAQGDALADQGSERELADLRAEWGEELEASARAADYRERAVAFRAIGQFRFRAKIELLRRGLDDESPACRGSALLSLERLSRDHPGDVNAVRPLLHELATNDGNQAVRRLAIMALRNGSPQRDTIGILAALGDDDEQDRELREAATKVAQYLRKKAGPGKCLAPLGRNARLACVGEDVLSGRKQAPTSHFAGCGRKGAKSARTRHRHAQQSLVAWLFEGGGERPHPGWGSGRRRAKRRGPTLDASGGRVVR